MTVYASGRVVGCRLYRWLMLSVSGPLYLSLTLCLCFTLALSAHSISGSLAHSCQQLHHSVVLCRTFYVVKGEGKAPSPEEKHRQFQITGVPYLWGVKLRWAPEFNLVRHNIQTCYETNFVIRGPVHRLLLSSAVAMLCSSVAILS